MIPADPPPTPAVIPADPPEDLQGDAQPWLRDGQTVPEGFAEVVAALSVARAQVNRVNVYRWTPVWSAANRGMTEVSAALVGAGATVDGLCYGGDTAMRCGRVEVAAMLLAAHPAQSPAG